MKKILLSICLLSLIISVFATDVSGNQSGIWDLSGSPYNIVGEITVPTNETLQIEAGVEVIAMGNYKITALGNILANGALNDTIRFYGNGGLNWGGLRLEDEVTTSQFNYCRISNTDDTNDYGIQSINSPVTINHSYLDDHQKAVSFSALSSNDPSVMVIRNSKVAYVQKSGITITDNSNVLIDSCEVTRCGLGASFYGAIQLSLQSNSHSCSPTITNNYIHHNDKQGITLANLYGYDNMAPIVEYNEISYNYTGIYLYVGKGYYKGNHIHHNFEENNADSGAGVMLYGSGADAVFTYNEVNNNYTGFYLTNGATANLGDLNNGATDDNGYNQIYDNIFYTGEIFSVYNASAIDMKAENNYWDSDDPAIIDITIIDGNDNPAYGIVDYEPYLSPFPPPTNVYVSEIIVTVFWDPPEVSNLTLTGYRIYLDGVMLANVGINVFEFQFEDLVTGEEYVAGVSAVYAEGESEIIEIQFNLTGIPPNPPNNVVLNPNLGILFWEAPQDPQFILIGFNIFLDGDFVASVGFDIVNYTYENLVPGQDYIAGVSAVYETCESEIIEVGCWEPHICNPPTNASYEIIDDYVHLTWEEPEPGSSHPFLNYRIYLDGGLVEETTELYCDIYDLVPGQTYMIGLTAFYEYLFESNPIELEIIFTGVNQNSIPQITELYQNYPNPFNPTTTISFSLTTEYTESTEIVIYNLKGQKVKTLECNNRVIAETTRLFHSITWNGTDDSGKPVSSGIYFYKLISDGKNIASKKMLLLK